MKNRENLTMNIFERILFSVTANSVIGIETPQIHGASAPTEVMRFFYAPLAAIHIFWTAVSTMVGCIGPLRWVAPPCSDSLNLIQSATFRLRPNDGSYPKLHGELVMPKSYSGLPEHYLYVPRTKDLDIDALNCAISRAQGVMYLVSNHFEDPDSSKYNDQIMSSACWAILGLLDQAHILLNGKE